jgi:hypothetical protein
VMVVGGVGECGRGLLVVAGGLAVEWTVFWDGPSSVVRRAGRGASSPGLRVRGWAPGRVGEGWIAVVSAWWCVHVVFSFAVGWRVGRGG